MVYFMENPIKLDDLGAPLFQETSRSCFIIYDVIDTTDKPHV